MSAKTTKLARREKAEETALTREDMEETVMQVLGIFAKQIGEAFALHGRRIDEVVGVFHDLAKDNRGVLLELAKFKQLHRVQGELAWLDGIHGRQALEAFKDATGMTSFAKLMQERVKELEAKREANPGLPEGVVPEPRYTWYCDQCPDLVAGDFPSKEEAATVRAAHVKQKHPEQTEGPVVEARA